ncbi:Na/Pi cotransporter family protein, partial [Clostridium sp. UBA4548]|uniref:Na/Pi cotransporter family protein n=1 Tax=Clostridium sp. UBA4548 TaxID=1946361 RepID=UPI0025C09912
MKELIFGLIGGTALLMYGVDKMGEGLEKASGEMMKKILSVLTGNVFSALLVGTLLTVLVQSSTAITVLTVGFVNAGLMKLPQAIGIIYGANIGTTITAQLMAFSFKFKLTDIALPVLGIGFAISYFAKNKTLKNIGEALMGFGMMFLGLKILNSGVPFMKESADLRHFFEMYASNPFIAVFLGAAATALVHSSSATVGLVMVLGQAGLINLETSVLIMLGDNIGTCITAQLASLTANLHARRTAWAHTLYNIIGVLVCLIFFPWFIKAIIAITNYLQPGVAGDLGVQIANSHTIFNVLSAVLFLPITKYYVKFLETVIRGKDKVHQGAMYLDRLLLNTPVAAFKASLSEITHGFEITMDMLKSTMLSIYKNDEKPLEAVKKNEELVNGLQKDVTLYIVDISKQPLNDSESIMVPAMISSINNVERIGDHIMDIQQLITNSIHNNVEFSDIAVKELQELESLIVKMFDNTMKGLKVLDMNLAKHTEELEDEVDALIEQLQANHLKRLNQECVNKSV